MMPPSLWDVSTKHRSWLTAPPRTNSKLAKNACYLAPMMLASRSAVFVLINMTVSTLAWLASAVTMDVVAETGQEFVILTREHREWAGLNSCSPKLGDGVKLKQMCSCSPLCALLSSVANR